MIDRRALFLLLVFLCSACASATGTFLQLGTDHPANPRATERPIEDPSAALRDGGGSSAAASVDVPGAASASTPGAYVCPMHEEVSADAPGECPKCGMTLVLRATLAQEEHPHDD